MRRSPKKMTDPRNPRTEVPFIRCPEAPAGLIWVSWGLRDFTGQPFRVPIPHQRVWEYIVVLDGTPTLTLEDGPHPLSPQHAICACTEGGMFQWQERSPGHTKFLVWLWQTPPLLHALAPPVGGALLVPLDREACRRLEAVHAATRQELTRPDAWSVDSLTAIRLQIEVELVRHLETTQRQSGDEALAHTAVRWMTTHLQVSNPVFLLCDYLQVSQSTLDRLFGKQFGVSPKDYHHRLCMQKAQSLLEDGNLQVKAIAFQLGYKHANAFSRAYKSFHGPARRAGK